MQTQWLVQNSPDSPDYSTLDVTRGKFRTEWCLQAYSKPAVQEPVVTGVADDRLMMTEKYNQIKAQKRSLQQKLHQYESEFYKKHGRKMKHHEDIAPVQQEYTEYKRLKALVVQLEEEGFGR